MEDQELQSIKSYDDEDDIEILTPYQVRYTENKKCKVSIILTLLGFLLLIVLLRKQLYISLYNYFYFHNNGNKLTIHVVPHSHFDPGWIFTEEENYYGLNSLNDCAKCSLDTIYNSLIEHKDRQFTSVEMIYFTRWYFNQTEEIRENVKKLVSEKRLSFATGGWVVHDTATTTYQDIINNMRLGMLFLKKEFDTQPINAFFIDNFGHSSGNNAILSELGFKTNTILRIDNNERMFRAAMKKLEFDWVSNSDLKNSKKIFTHISQFHYNPSNDLFPRNVFYDQTFYKINDTEFEKIIPRIVEQFKISKAAYKNKNEYLLLYGDDFSYLTKSGFIMIERLMKYFYENPKYGIEIKYSNLDNYFQFFNNKFYNFDVFKSDFFPMIMKKRYWSGFYSSRPFLKYLIKESSKLNRMLNKILAERYLNIRDFIIQSNYDQELLNFILNFQENLSLVQHHDAVTGTSNERVSQDYINKLLNLEKKGHRIMSNFIKNLVNDISGDEFEIFSLSTRELFNKKIIHVSKNKIGVLIIINQNIGENLFQVSLPISTDQVEFYKYDKNNQSLEYDIFCLEDICTINLIVECSRNMLFNILYFKYKDNTEIKPTSIDPNKTYDIFESNGEQTMNFNYNSGFSFKDKKNNIDVNFTISHSYLENKYNMSEKGPGAYVFYPSNNTPIQFSSYLNESLIFKGINFIKIILKFQYSAIHILINKNFIDLMKIRSFINKIELQSQGLEFLLEIKSNIDNTVLLNGRFRNEFWTDTNSMRMLRRITDHKLDLNLDYKGDIAGNMYPITKSISIKNRKNKKFDMNIDYDRNENNQITLYSDRSQAGTSINSGQILIVLNRWTNTDDHLGLADKLHEFHSENGIIIENNLQIGTNFQTRNFINNALNFQPFIAFKSEEKLDARFSSYLNFHSKLSNLFTLKGNCIVSIFHYTAESFFLQFFNQFDPYFDSKNQDCYIEINPENFAFQEVSLSTVELNFKTNLSKSYHLAPQNFLTFKIQTK